MGCNSSKAATPAATMSEKVRCSPQDGLDHLNFLWRCLPRGGVKEQIKLREFFRAIAQHYIGMHFHHQVEPFIKSVKLWESM